MDIGDIMNLRNKIFNKVSRFGMEEVKKFETSSCNVLL